MSNKERNTVNYVTAECMVPLGRSVPHVTTGCPLFHSSFILNTPNIISAL